MARTDSPHSTRRPVLTTINGRLTYAIIEPCTPPPAEPLRLEQAPARKPPRQMSEEEKARRAAEREEDERSREWHRLCEAGECGPGPVMTMEDLIVALGGPIEIGNWPMQLQRVDGGLNIVICRKGTQGEIPVTEQLQNELAKCPAGMAARLVGVSIRTLNNWRKAGRIDAEQTPAGRWLFDVRPFLQKAEKVAS